MEFRYIEVAISQRHACDTVLANLFFSLETAISVGIAQRHYAALAAVGLQGNLDVSVRSGGDMPRGPDSVGHHERAEALRELQPSIIGIAGGRIGRR